MVIKDLIKQSTENRVLLDKCITSLKENNRKLAYAERNYRKALTQESLRLKILGYEGELGKTEPVAWTKADTIAMGLPEVAELRLQRDLARGDVDTLLQKIYQIKLELDIIQSDMAAMRKGV